MKAEFQISEKQLVAMHPYDFAMMDELAKAYENVAGLTVLSFGYRWRRWTTIELHSRGIELEFPNHDPAGVGIPLVEALTQL